MFILILLTSCVSSNVNKNNKIDYNFKSLVDFTEYKSLLNIYNKNTDYPKLTE